MLSHNQLAQAKVDTQGVQAVAPTPIGFDGELERRLLRQQGQSWNVVTLAQLGLPAASALVQPYAMDLSGQGGTVPALATTNPMTSLTQELNWWHQDASRLEINSPRVKASLGRNGNSQVQLGRFGLRIGSLMRDWSTISLLALEGDLEQPEAAAKLLLLANGLSRNSGQQYNEAGDSLLDWGRAPTQIELVPLQLELPYPVKRVQAWALDERGQPQKALALRPLPDNQSLLMVEPGDNASLWYYLEITPE